MKFKSFDDIKKLSPIFNYGSMDMIDWFDINIGFTSISIKSGLKHADGETLSPFNIEITIFIAMGEYPKDKFSKYLNDIALSEFSKWWNSLNVIKEKLGKNTYHRLPYNEEQEENRIIVRIDKKFIRNKYLESLE